MAKEEKFRERTAKTAEDSAVTNYESEAIPYSTKSSTPPGRLTLKEYNESLSRKRAAEHKGYIAQFEDWLLSDKWPELDACYILAGLIPKSMEADEEKLIRVVDGDRPTSSDISEYHRIKGIWLSSNHEKSNPEKFVDSGSMDLSGSVRPEYAYIWGTERGIKSPWLDSAITAGKFIVEDKALAAISAQGEIHHQYFVGLQLMIALEESRETIFDWAFLLFRSLQEKKFISSFSKLGLEDLSDAVACARYHVLSNSIGGVSVEYMEESNKKAWVRFRYPRWIYSGAALCGIPIEVSRGYLKGWYAHNGVSLGNPNLGFVCVSEDMTGQFGLCGYFKEYDHKLSSNQLLRFSPNERVPEFSSASQPKLSDEVWGKRRLVEAKRNYSVSYFENSLLALIEVAGIDTARKYGERVGRLIGAQYYQSLAKQIGAVEGGPKESAEFLATMMTGLSIECSIHADDHKVAVIRHSIPKFLQNSGHQHSDVLLQSWIEIWRGTIISCQIIMETDCEVLSEKNELRWTIRVK
ncbi:MAG: hypothetical protein CMQ30_07735 [Gammaproteobacteria bacterium]|nr:hypothetical protein [Gammaproteobacteria bacterium]